MTATIVPFPATKRLRFVLRQAKLVLVSRPSSREKVLATQLRIQTKTLAKKGIPSSVVARDVDALCLAIRLQMQRLTASGNAA